MEIKIENKIILTYNKGYRVSRYGQVFNSKNNPVKGQFDRKGYPTIGVWLNKKPIHIYVHRLQAYQKYGEAMFEEGIIVRHLNDVKTDNSWDNIAIGTYKDNHNDMSKEMKSLMGKKGCAKKKTYNREEIVEFHNKNRSCKETMKFFNMKAHSTLYRIMAESRLINC